MGHLTCVAEPSVCWAGAEEEGNVYGALRWLTPVIHSMCVLTLGHRDSPTTDEQTVLRWLCNFLQFLGCRQWASVSDSAPTRDVL